MTSKRDAAEGATVEKAGDKVAEKASSAARTARASGEAVEVVLQHARSHHLRWVVLGGVLGGLCVAKLGTLGQWLGYLLLALAAWAAFRVVQTLLHPPGTILVEGERVLLPRGLCVGRPVETTRGAVTASYLLRKSVAWNQAAPVLVVETGGKVLAYPRDWFAGESDQRRILDALLGERSAPAPVEPPRTALPPLLPKLPGL